MNALLDELTWRGMIADSTDREALAAHLDAGMVSSYVGFDPTAASLHVGHLMQLIMARRLQAHGHRPVLLIGGATGMIGDPKQTGERKMNPVETIAQWTAELTEQVRPFVSFEGENAALVVNNLEWTGELSALELLRDVGKYFSVSRMLARDVVARRLESGISYTEFSYVLLQSLDFRELNRRYGVTLQTGAQDQWGNITAGAEFVRRCDGTVVHGLVTPLLTKSDGTKFGKTEGGAVWLDPELTSPYAFHQFWLNVEDEKVIELLKIYTDRSREEIDDLAAQTADAPHLRVAQRALADDLTDLVHGVEQRRAAELAAQALFGRGELRDLDARTLASLYDELGGVELTAEDGQLPGVTDVMVAAGLVDSKSAARRAINEGGAYLNNVKVEDSDARLTQADLIDGRHAIVRRGRKTVGIVRAR